MKKDSEIETRFIQLRTEGKSLKVIAKELGVCKQTLINWTNKNTELLNNLKTLRQEHLIEQLQISKVARLQILAKLKNRLEEEIDNRDLSDIPTAKLFELVFKTNEQLQKEDSELSLEKEVDFIEKETLKYAV